MKKDNMVTMLLVVGGVGLGYWYVTRYGPAGAAYNTAGQQVAPTWWDTWFGGAAPAQVPAGTQNTTTPTNQTQTPGGGTQPAPSASTDVRTRLLTASGGVMSQTADQWNYYRNNLFPPALTPEQFGMAFQRTDPMPGISVDQFINALVGAGINPANPNAGVSGLRGVVAAAPVPQVPSMSFGGSLAQMRPRVGAPSVFRNRMQGGGYIQ